MRAIWATAVKEMRLLLRDPGGLIMLFVLPAVFIIALSVALQGAFSSGKDVDKLALLLVDEDGGAAGRDVAKGIRETGLFRVLEPGRALTRDEAERELRQGRTNIVVVVPRGASRALRFEAEAGIEAILDPVVSKEVARATESTIRSVVSRLALEELAARFEESQTDLATSKVDLAREKAKGEAERAALKAELAGAQATLKQIEAMRQAPPGAAPPAPAPRPKKVDVEKAAEDAAKQAEKSELIKVRPAEKMLRVRQSYAASTGSEIRPNSVQQNVPGWTIFALFWLAQLLALNIVSERTSGTQLRISASPISPHAYLLGKIIPFFIINLLQAVLMFAVGLYLLPRLGCARLVIQQPGPIVLLTLAISLVSIAFGLLMASVSRSSLVVAAFAAAILIIMTVIGGIMVPKYIMPAAMRRLSLIVPHGWALDGYLKILVKGQGTRDILRELGVLCAFAGVFFAFALARLRLRSR